MAVKIIRKSKKAGVIKSAFRFFRGSVGAFEGAKFTRVFRGWRTSSEQNADQDLLPDVRILRERSRDLARNNAVGAGIIKTATSGVVGRGLRLQSQIDREFLKLSDDQADEWQNITERKWRSWAMSTDSDASNRQNFAEQQRLAYSSKLQSGDVFALLPLIKTKNGNVNKLKIKLIEADIVSNPHHGLDTDKLRDGVQLGKHDRPESYHIMGEDHRWKEVKAVGSRTGRPNILHLFTQERPGQSRGIPFLTSVMRELRQLGDYQQSELTASVVASMFTVFIKSNNPNALDTVVPTHDEKTDDELNDYTLGPGAIMQLEENEEIQIADPKRPFTNFDLFITSIIKQIGMATQIPFEILMKEFNSSFSASRAARIEALKFFLSERDFVADRFCQPIYCEFLTEEVLNGRIKADGFFLDPEIKQAYCRSLWIGDSGGQIDEVKEIQAAKQRIEANLSTHQIEASKLGAHDWKQIARTLAAERRMMENENISSSTTGRNEEQSGGTPNE